MAKIKENKWTDTTDRINFPVNTVSNNAQLARSDGSKGAITGITGGGAPDLSKIWTGLIHFAWFCWDNTRVIGALINAL